MIKKGILSRKCSKFNEFNVKIYFMPMNFTDYCYDMPPTVQIGVITCSHSLCVTIIEPRILAGLILPVYKIFF